MAADIKENDDFSKGPISKTILRLAVPMVLAQFVNVLYNIVDRMYIGHISDTSVDALTGVGVTFPILLMVTAFANLFGSGGTPLFSMARGAAQQGGEEGEKQRERAADVMNNTFSMLVITGVILCIVVLLVKKPVLYLFGASDATYPYADSYLSVYMLGSVFMMVSLGMNGFINAQGFANRGMLTVVIGAVVNIALDPLFIFVLDMGVPGAALGTALATMIGGLAALAVLLLRESPLAIRYPGSWKITRSCLINLWRVGVPLAAERAALSSAQVLLVRIVSQLGTVAIAANSLAVSAEGLCYMAGYGIQSAAVTLIGQAVGANRKDMAKRFAWLCTGLGMGVMALSGVGLWIFAPTLMSLFTTDAAVIALGAQVLRIEAWAEPMFGASIVASGAMQGAGDSTSCFVLNIFSMWCIRLTLAFLLAPRLGLMGVWGAMCCELSIRGLLFLIRLARGKWLEKGALS